MSDISHMGSAAAPSIPVHPLHGRRRLLAAAHRDDLQTALVVVLLASAVIHLAVTPTHLREYTAFGGFFITAAVLQVVAAVLCARRASRAVVCWAGGLSLVIAGVWLVSRTVGLPVGPEAGNPEAVGLADVVSTIYEVVAAVVAAPLAARLRRGEAVRIRVTPNVSAWAVLAGWITVGAILAGH